MEQLATVYWAEPLAILGIVEQIYFNVSQNQASQVRMNAYFVQYVIEAYDDVLLEESSSYYDIISNSLP